MLSAIVTVFGVVIFLAITLAVKMHFRSSFVPQGMMLISITSVIGVCAFAFKTWHGVENINAALSISLFILALAIFIWAIKSTWRANFKLAFDPTPPHQITRSGIYRYVRHPFYVSYILYWIGCAVAAWSVFSALICLFLAATYIFAATREEQSFEVAGIAAEYVKYRRDTGMFLPRLWGRSK
jgi:protein-S-isoprenylcysteine O-methyltransferase Ste14